MKTATKFSALMIVFLVAGLARYADAQGKGRYQHNDRHYAQHGHQKNHWKHARKRGAHGHDESHHYHDGHHVHHHAHAHRVHQAVHHHDHYCEHRPVIAYHRPRYIHYRDYDVYYDIQREVYISYSGRNWTVTASVPVVLRHVDTRRVVRMEVDYDHDDFVAYLETARPSYRRIYTGM